LFRPMAALGLQRPRRCDSWHSIGYDRGVRPTDPLRQVKRSHCARRS
jgi:hypothetical protein